MAKHLKLNIKNTQIAEAINLGGLKQKLAKKKEAEATPATPKAAAKKTVAEPAESAKISAEEAPRVRARSKSVFSESAAGKSRAESADQEITAPAETDEPANALESIEEPAPVETVEVAEESQPASQKTSEELRREIFGSDVAEAKAAAPAKPKIFDPIVPKKTSHKPNPFRKEPVSRPIEPKQSFAKPQAPVQKDPVESAKPLEMEEPKPVIKAHSTPTAIPPRAKLGPTGRHISDLLPKKPAKQPEQAPAPRQHQQSAKPAPQARQERQGPLKAIDPDEKARTKPRPREFDAPAEDPSKKTFTKEFRDIKPKRQETRSFDARDRQGLRDGEEDQRWRKKRQGKQARVYEDQTIRPSTLKIRAPITIKELADKMKLKSSELVAKLFLQGLVVTLNDYLSDDTTIQLLGHEFGCEITIDTSEEERIRITDKSVAEEIAAANSDDLVIRAPIVAFMGHVDHGKTSLIDAIRSSNRAAGEAGAITQHIGAFRCHTAVGDIAILDTPGHEAFSAMRARGADVTDIVVLVVAGDEGMRQQTIEAIEHAKAAKVTIVVAINKSDKPNFNPENVYRQLAEQELLPEAWGGQTLTVNCSAVTKAGIKELLETLALQAEVLELRANPKNRARGTVLESEMHKGLGSVATVLVQNGTLNIGDSLVFEQHWGHVKTMRDEYGKNLKDAGPSTPVAITGLSGLPEAGQEFIVVKSEREAREISAVRLMGFRQSNLQQKKALTLENLVQQATPTTKKVLNIVLRADVQGSLEALRVALEKIKSTKAEINIIFAGVGEVSESDIQLAAPSKALVLGFHTRVESHAESLVKQLKVVVKQHDIIYHAVDDVKEILTGMLDKIPQETDRGKAIVKAIFKSSQVGLIAGCQVTEGVIQRNLMIRVIRNGEVIGKSPIASLKRVKEDVREVAKGLECGVALSKFTDLQVDDVLEAYEITYLTQEL